LRPKNQGMSHDKVKILKNISTAMHTTRRNTSVPPRRNCGIKHESTVTSVTIS
jgi:hypothetical protein